VRAYEDKLLELRKLFEDRRVRAEDRPRIESSVTSTQVLRDQYNASFRDASLSLVSTIGVEPQDDYVILDPPDGPSPYLKFAQTPEGREEMVRQALDNNPRFKVLEDAIADTELQRQQAIIGEYDITAFVHGTQFPLGAETFDDRVSGWLIGAGVTVRLNDKRVLTATRLKAEAQIREFKAQIESERLRILREISTETDTLQSYHETKTQILALLEQKKAEFAERKRDYLEGAAGPRLMIDDVLYPLDEYASAQIRMASNAYQIGLAESSLMGASGDVYRIVGMELDDRQGSGTTLPAP
jgi:outer membrane protein TolC